MDIPLFTFSVKCGVKVSYMLMLPYGGQRVRCWEEGKHEPSISLGQIIFQRLMAASIVCVVSLWYRDRSHVSQDSLSSHCYLIISCSVVWVHVVMY